MTESLKIRMGISLLRRSHAASMGSQQIRGIKPISNSLKNAGSPALGARQGRVVLSNHARVTQ
jgi:hypothetical protein